MLSKESIRSVNSSSQREFDIGLNRIRAVAYAIAIHYCHLVQQYAQKESPDFGEDAAYVPIGAWRLQLERHNSS